MVSTKSIIQRRYLDEDAAYDEYMKLITKPTAAGIRAALGLWTLRGQYAHCTNNLGINFIVLNPKKVMAATGGNPLPLIEEALRVEHEDTVQLLLWQSVQTLLRSTGRYHKLLRDAYVHRGIGWNSSWVDHARRGEGVSDVRLNAMMLSRLRFCLMGANADAWDGTTEYEEVWGFFDSLDNALTTRVEDGRKQFVLAPDSNLYGLTDQGVLDAARLIMAALQSVRPLLGKWRRIAGRLHQRPDLQEILWAEIMAGLEREELTDVTMGEVKQLNPDQQIDVLRHAGAYIAPTEELDTWQFGGCDAFRLLVELCLADPNSAAGRGLLADTLVKFEAFDPIKLLRVVCQKEWWADNDRRLRRTRPADAPENPELAMLTWMREVLEPRVREAGYGIGEVTSIVVLPGSTSLRFVATIDGCQVIQPLDRHRYRPQRGHRVAVTLADLAPSEPGGYVEAELLPLSD